MTADMDPDASLPVGPPRRARISLDLGALKPHWDHWCRSTGTASSERLRQLVLEALAQHRFAEPSIPAAALIDDEGPRQRVEVRLTVRELEAAEQFSERAGMSVNRWIVAAIRACLSGEPQFGDRELAALAESSHQIAALGRNLNQIARALNMARDGPVRHRLDVLNGLRVDVDHHLDCVGRLIRANLDRWSR